MRSRKTKPATGRAKLPPGRNAIHEQNEAEARALGYPNLISMQHELSDAAAPRNGRIEAWQAGIEPATGERLQVLGRLSQEAFELIKIIELEKSGIRDGDGRWHYDALGAQTQEVAYWISQLNDLRNLLGHNLRVEESAFDDLPF